MNIDSFTDDQLLNLVNETIIEETEFSERDMTGGYIQATATNKSKIVSYKINLLFGYDKNKNSRQHQKEITIDSYFVWAKAILIKTQSLIISTAGAELDEMNRRMNKTSKKEKTSNGNGKGNGYEVLGNRLTTSSTSVVLPTKTEEIAYRVSDYLLSKILTSKPNFKQPTIASWVKDIDRAIRIDNRTEDELIGCINWIYTDQGSFWIPNIMSAKKLREKFDMMESQMITKQEPMNKVQQNLKLMQELRDAR